MNMDKKEDDLKLLKVEVEKFSKEKNDLMKEKNALKVKLFLSHCNKENNLSKRKKQKLKKNENFLIIFKKKEKKNLTRIINDFLVKTIILESN